MIKFFSIQDNTIDLLFLKSYAIVKIIKPWSDIKILELDLIKDKVSI